MLETKRLILLPYIPEHAPLLQEMNRDPEVVRFAGEIQGSVERFTVFLKDGTFIGQCGLRTMNGETDLGFRFVKKFWGMGYATEAAWASLNHGLQTLGHKRIIAYVSPGNIKSHKLLQKLGMSFRGLRRECNDNQAWVLYDISDREFKACAD
jgi:ribosomal-protein-alanine N-acetyltransferase